MNQDEEYKLNIIADQAGAELAELRAENERLRKALEKIANHCRPHRGGEEMALDWIEREAYEALEVKV